MAKKQQKSKPKGKEKPKKKGRKSKNYFCWLIAYIDPQFMHKVNDQLGRNEDFHEIEAHIPTIKVLKKSFKGENHFDEVPLMFNYGFFKCPRHLAVNKDFLDKLKAQVTCIYAWVKDPAKVLSAPKIRPDGGPIYTDNQVPVATCSSEAVAKLIGKTDNYSIHDSNDINQLNPGDMVTLKGYPFDNVNAKVISIDVKKKRVKVEIKIFETTRPVDVSFDNVFFTVYQNKGYDDSVLFAGAMSDITDHRKVNKKTAKKFTDEEG